MERIRKFLSDTRALTTVEYVIVFPFLFIIVFYALQVGMALLLILVLVVTYHDILRFFVS